MNTFELRKIILIGYSFDALEGAPLLDRDGLPIDPRKHPVKMRVAFWIPAKPPFQRCAGHTEVIEARRFEIQALKDGSIDEHCQDFTFDFQPSIEQMRQRLMPVWEALTVESLGVLPSAVPIDRAPKMALQFTQVR